MRRTALSLLATLSAVGLLAASSSATAAAAGRPGSLDPTFGSGGKVLTDLGAQALPSDAVLQPNGDILVSLQLGNDFGLVRYLPSGKLDPSFGNGGVARAVFGTLNGQVVSFTPANALALQADGKIVEVGEVQTASGRFDRFGVARFNPNGSLDQSFGHGGLVTTEFFAHPLQGVRESADAVLVQPNGKILVGGLAQQGQDPTAPALAALARYNSNGTLDASFGSGGKVASQSVLGNVTALGLDAAGDIFVLPASEEFNPAGRLDAGVTAAPITASSSGGPDVFLPGGGSLQTETVSEPFHSVDVRVQQFDANGEFDSSDSSPAIDYAAGQARNSASSIALEPDGRVIVGGAHFSDSTVFGLAGLNSNLSLDSTFGNAGTLTTSFQGNDGVNALAIQPDGKIIAVGDSQSTNGVNDIAVARYVGG